MKIFFWFFLSSIISISYASTALPNVSNAVNIQEDDQKLSKKSHVTLSNKSPWSVGAGVIISPAVYKNTDATILAVPAISYNSEKLRINGPSIIYNLWKYKSTSTNVKLFLYPQNFRAKDSNDAQLRQLNDRHYLAMVGVGHKIKIKIDNINLGTLNVAANLDATWQTKGGYSLDIDYSKAIFIPFKMDISSYVLISFKIGLMYNSDKITNYFYGISKAESLESQLPEYNVGAAYSPYMGIFTNFVFARNWNVSLMTRLNKVDDAIYKSPMVDRQYVFTSMMFLSYNF